MDTVAQIRDREQRLREARRLGLCTGRDPVRTCLERLAAHERRAALAPELLAFVRRLLRALDDDPHETGIWLSEENDWVEDARALVARAEGEE